ncbi:uncharacterized protein LOC121876303 [Homarus americanus]|uniref:uncharacterized protein LOC121876303 n=1 Tax=Homarus americanus TaxID=6706 RepID=UPI001C43E65A|nr:uncharacterized protein LOC121876303 [Homarus americanus]
MKYGVSVNAEATASRSTQEDPASPRGRGGSSVTTHPRDDHPGAVKSSAVISVKPLFKLINFNDDDLVEVDCSGNHTSSQEVMGGVTDICMPEANAVHNMEFPDKIPHKIIKNKRQVNIIPFQKEKFPQRKTRATCSLNVEGDCGTNQAATGVGPTVTCSSVTFPGSTFQIPAGEGRTEDTVSSLHMRQHSSTLSTNSQNVSFAPPGCSTSRPNAKIQYASVSMTDICRSTSRTDIHNLPKTLSGTLEHLKSQYTKQQNGSNTSGNTNIASDVNITQKCHKRSSTVTVDSCIRNRNTDGDTRTSINNTVGDVMSGVTNTTRKGDDHTIDSSRGRSEEETDEGQPSARREVRTCGEALQEIVKEVELGLRRATLRLHHDWNRCHHCIEEVRKALQGRGGVRGEALEGPCLTFLAQVLTLVVSRAAPGHLLTAWWRVVEVVESVVTEVCTWPPLLVRAGNILLQELVNICHEMHEMHELLTGGSDRRLSRWEHLTEIGYSLAGVFRKIVNQASRILDRGAYPPPAPKSPIISEKSFVEEALAALLPSYDIYANLPTWMDPSQALYPGQTPGATTPAAPTGEFSYSSASMGDVTLIEAPREDEVSRWRYINNMKENISAALAMLDPHPRHRQRDIAQPTLKRTVTLLKDPRDPGVSCSPPDPSTIEWNLRYWRSVMAEQILLLTDVPLFELQVSEIIRLIDGCCALEL